MKDVREVLEKSVIFLLFGRIKNDLSIWEYTHPPLIFTQKMLYKNGSEWPKNHSNTTL